MVYVYIVNQFEENGQIRLDGSVAQPKGAVSLRSLLLFAELAVLVQMNRR
jgi:hypothetical protein